MDLRSGRLRLAAALFASAAAVTQFAPSATPQANVQGQWQTLPYTMPINPIHVALMYNGKVLVVSGSGNVPLNKNLEAALWDPQAGTITTQPISWDMFCNGMVVLPDGRPFVLGGTLQYDPFYGQLRTSAYDPNSNIFTDQENMAHGRWYPTGSVLGDGRVLVFGGFLEGGHTNTLTEIYALGTGWGAAVAAPWSPPLYPRLHLLPSGKVFYSGSTTASRIFDPSSSTWTASIANTNYSGTRTYGSSVLLPLTPANGYKPVVMILGGDDPATPTTELIDLSVTNPKWVYGPSMSEPRVQMNATILPNGKLLALGGSLNDEDTTTASLNADMYDPTSNSFSPAGTEAFPRLYHSVSLLMPDATVWVAGSNPVRGTYEPHMEIYSPPYLFNSNGTLATRPSITSVSSSTIGYGSAFQVQTPDAATTSTVVLMRNGACTHSFNTDQRYVGLSFTTGSGVLNVTAPPNGNIAPPGYYMLFILNSAGVPSVAKMVQLSTAPGDQPPTGIITTPASNEIVQAGQPVAFSGSGTSPNGTIASYFWSFVGGTPSSSNLANPGNVTFSAAGTFDASLTVTDNDGITDPHPPTRVITVPDFSLTLSPGSTSIMAGNSTTYSATVSPGTGFVGTVSFTATGLPVGATASFNPPTVQNSGSSVMTISTGTSTPSGNYLVTVTATGNALVHSTVASLIILTPGQTTAINFGSGFTANGMQFNGHTKLNGSRLQLTDQSAGNEVASAFWKTPVNVQGFTNDFTFQETNPTADGFTFTIQGVGPTAIGQSGGNLGYGGIAQSIAVKFDLHSSNGDDGQNSTGLYTNGTAPTTPSNALGGGVNLLTGDTMQVQMAYDGTTLSMTITDTTNSTDTFSISWPVNIPSLVGGSTAYVGFTGSTGGSTAIQELLSWSYVPTSNTPDFSVAVNPSSQSVAQGGSTSYTTTVTPLNGFGGTVSFSVSGLPTGATPTFVPTTVTGSGSSTLTIATTGAVATGNYPLTVTAISGALSHAASTSLFINPSGSTAVVNFSSGFTATGMKFNGHTKLNGTRLQLTDSVAGNEVASAFWTTPVNVASFTNDFTFQLTNPNADGFTFTLQGVGPSAIGLSGSNLGYGGPPGIATSVAVKFDLHSNAGEGINSTGIYTNGATPTVPAITLGGGVDLHSGDILQVHMTYDGTTLTMTISDTAVPADTFTTSWTINIPSTVGASTAYVGFTAGTGGSTATQEILTWSYDTSGSTPPPAATPTFNPLGGNYASTQNVTISDTTSGASIFYTLDGTTPGTSVGGSTMQFTTTPISVTSSKTINAIATASGFSSSIVGTAIYTISGPADFSISAAPSSQTVNPGNSTTYTVTTSALNGFTGTITLSATGLPAGASATFNPTTITGSGTSTMTVTTGTSTPTGTSTLTITGTSAALTHSTTTSILVQTGSTAAINFGSGFTATGIKFNGHTKLNGTRLQLTDSVAGNEVASAFWTTPVNVASFTNDFTFQLTNPNADGFTFTLQGVGPSAIGLSGSNLGYGGPPGIATSVAVKFDLHSNAGEGINSTGIYTNGATPTVPAITLGGGVDLHSGDILQVHMTYDGTTLTMTISDTAVPADTFTTSWTINIPSTVGASTAYVGFTAGTGGSTATQEILTWSYDTSGSTPPPAATPTFNPLGGNYASTQNVTISDTTSGASIFYTLDGTTPGTSVGGSTMQFTTTPISVTSSKTINAIATASGFSSSIVGTAIYTISGPADFSISAAPSSQTVNPGNSTTYTVTTSALNGFTGTITLSATGLPAGASATFNPTTITGSGTSTMTVTTGTSTPTGTSTLTITGTSAALTHSTTTSILVQTGSTAAINFGSGFTATGIKFNGHTKLNGTRLQLTDSVAGNEVASAFWTTPVNVASFTNDFTFQLTNPNADGFTFTLQGVGPSAIGLSGSNLGYGGPPGIATSVAVKFDLHSNAGEGINSTGIYTNGATPTVPAITLGGGVDLHSGDILQVHMTYDGTTLTMTISDTAVPADTFTTSWTINIPSTVGASTAYVGFTAGTGGSTATQEILTWTYSNP